MPINLSDLSTLSGARVTLMGLGLLGRGVGDAAFLSGLGARVLVTDRKSEADLAESVERLSGVPNVSFRLGGHREEDFTDADLVVKAAGVPLDSPFIAAARAAGVPVAMSTALFAKLAAERGATVVGVTGTRGKTTTTQMIFTSLVRAGRRAHLGGNVRGVSTLAQLPEVKPGDLCVLELDSWQLQGFGDLKISPNVSVFTNLQPDHQNYYPSMDAYFADKANIFCAQGPGDALFVGPEILDRVLAAHPPVAPVVPPPLPPDWTLKIPGEHNRSNAALAVAALRSLGLPESEIRGGIESFEGVEGRLQKLGEKNGVTVYNDNNATTPDATIAALRALGRKGNVVLIMGGADKGLDMGELMEEIDRACKKVIWLPGTGTARFDYAKPVATMQEAVTAAFAVAAPGDTILLSPAFASFGLFKNEYDRNDQFVKATNLSTC